jgi:hypothetical protein
MAAFAHHTAVEGHAATQWSFGGLAAFAAFTGAPSLTSDWCITQPFDGGRWPRKSIRPAK